MNALETASVCVPTDPGLPDEMLARAALAACEAQTRVARETLGRAAAPCRVPCSGCLAAARAVADLVMGTRMTGMEPQAPVIVQRVGK